MPVKLHFGYLIAAIGYMVGIFALSSVPEAAPGAPAGPTAVAPPVFWNLLHIPLFAGLASCLLFSVSNGEWRRPIPTWLYGAIGLVATSYAVFDELRQGSIVGRHASLEDILLNLTGIVGLLLVHRCAGGSGTNS